MRAKVDTRGKQHDRKLLPAKPVLPVAGEYLHSRASKPSSFTHTPQTGNWRTKLTASSGASGFAISATRLSLFRRLVNSRKPKAIIRISASVGAMRRSLCRPRRSRDCMRTTSSWPPRLTAYSLGRPRRERVRRPATCTPFRCREAGGKKHSGKATQDEQPAKDGHKHRPSVRPAIVNAHNGKPSDEQEDARHEDERGVAGNLFRQRRERANVQQHAGSDSEKGWADQAGDRFRGCHPVDLRSRAYQSLSTLASCG